MDPLSAFSVACNVLQVVELGVRILSKAADYRASATGNSSEQNDLRDVLQSLNNLNANLQSSLPSPMGYRTSSNELLNLIEANNKCLLLSNEFIDLLNRLKVKDRHAIFESIKMSIKTVWHKDKMDAMAKSISQARDNLNIAFLVYMNSKQATQLTQTEILRNTTRIEGSILQAVTVASNSIHGDIRSLAQQLENVSLNSMQQKVSDFSTAHHDLFDQLTTRLDSIFAMYSDFRAYSDDAQISTARQNIIDSLHFPQIRERKDTIPQAHNNTYRWILESSQGGLRHWDNFRTWLRSSSNDQQIYWVHGKIGAGKTTLMRYIDDNIVPSLHMVPWAVDTSVVRASCFFWNAGNKLQKSTAGLLRTILTQLLEQMPKLIPQVVQPRKWQTAQLAGAHVIDWTESELQDCLREFILYATKTMKVLLIVDGLDEFEGTDEAREGLIAMLINCAASRNVKLCVSSRPWNIFKDAFGDCPQLKVDDLTYNDISRYVREQLYGNKQFCRLMKYDNIGTEALVTAIIGKAAGVFLWVRLVVRELLKGLRDGDGIKKLIAKVEQIPADLDDYFMHMIELIEPQNRKETSQLLQLALYHEDAFTSLHSNYLLDFSFIDEGKPDFALDPQYDFECFEFTDTGAMAFRIESTLRKINSRCMGMLECQVDEDEMNFFRLQDFRDNDDDEQIEDDNDGEDSDMYVTPTSRGFMEDAGTEDSPKRILATAHLTVGFLHRSLRDFLMTPKIQDLLQQYSHGAYNARMFFRNARMVQLVALNRAEVDLYAAIGLASYILCTLTIPGYRDTASAARVATIIRPVIENLVNFRHTGEIHGWYVSAVLRTWHFEKSTFLTLAIDFGLESYLHSNLTIKSIESKEGRPILDHILRPRFAGQGDTLCQLPSLNLLRRVLTWGADPNQSYLGISVWALFLYFAADRSVHVDSQVELTTYFETFKTLLHHGADVLLPMTWFVSPASLSRTQSAVDDWTRNCGTDVLFMYLLDVDPVFPENGQKTGMYAVSDILELFRPYHGAALDELKFMAHQREIQRGVNASSD